MFRNTDRQAPVSTADGLRNELGRLKHRALAVRVGGALILVVLALSVVEHFHIEATAIVLGSVGVVLLAAVGVPTLLRTHRVNQQLQRAR